MNAVDFFDKSRKRKKSKKHIKAVIEDDKMTVKMYLQESR
jgi:hypothetical protein